MIARIAAAPFILIVLLGGLVLVLLFGLGAFLGWAVDRHA